MPRRVLAASFIALAIFSSHRALAASGERIGDAVVITNVVLADFAAKQRKLAVGDDIRQDETIEVNADAQGEFKLDDETKLALGPGARLTLDKFVYDKDTKSGLIAINMIKGAFRFITGIASKPTYVVKTPSAAIAVRGTVFDVFILQDRSTWVLLHEGALEATGTKNVCHVLDRPGQLVRIDSDGTVSPPLNWSGLPGSAAVPFDSAFPFVINRPAVDPNASLSREAIMGAVLPAEPEKVCLNPIRQPPKIQKANIAPPRPAPQPQKNYQPKQAARPAKPTRTVKGNGDDGWGNGIRGMDIVIGGGLGGGYGGRGHTGGRGGGYGTSGR